MNEEIKKKIEEKFSNELKMSKIFLFFFFTFPNLSLN